MVIVNDRRVPMKLSGWKNIRLAILSTVCFCLSAGMTFAAAADAGQITDGHKAKVKGVIISRSGNLVKIQDQKSGTVDVIKVGDSTKIEHDKAFFSQTATDVRALVPGLTIEAKGVGNADGQLEAAKIKFHPDAFAVEVAMEQQVAANQAASSKAQTTADQGVANADKARSTADQGLSTAQAAGAAAAKDAAAAKTVNQRVSDLADYTTLAETQVYFRQNGSSLDAKAKADLDQLVSSTSSATGYMIEIAGYASSDGGTKYNQKLSDERAISVVHYLIENGNVPMQRIVVPAGYGATHPAAENTDRKGRALNRRVEVKVLVNKGLHESSQVAAVSF
jgi:outer membrane protein OmpA-like peptidoglycan-associated protein